MKHEQCERERDLASGPNRRPEARQIVEGAIEAALNGQQEPKAALDDAAKQINDKLAQYNSANK